MANQDLDLAGLLTGISNRPQPVQRQPIPGSPNFRGMFGAQMASDLQAGVGKLVRGGAPSQAQKMQQFMSQLDLNSVEDLTKLAKIMQASGDMAGAAKVAAKIDLMNKEKVLADKQVLKAERETKNKGSLAAAVTKAGYLDLGKLIAGGDPDAYKKGLELITPAKGKNTLEDIIDPVTGVTHKVILAPDFSIISTVGVSQMPTLKSVTLPNGKLVWENDKTGERSTPQDTPEAAEMDKNRLEKLYSDLAAVDNVLVTVAEAKKLAEGGMTTGIFYNLASLPVGTDARTLETKLRTLRATLAFDRLQKMRDDSKTGGALGQVSNIELQLLESALTALDPIVGEVEFKKQLEKVEKHYNNFKSSLLGQPIDIDWTLPSYKGKTAVVDGVRYLTDPADPTKVFAIGKVK